MDSFCILALLEVSQSIKSILIFQNRWKCKYGVFSSLRPVFLQRLNKCSNRIRIHQPLELRGWCMHRSSYAISHSQNTLTSSKIQRGWGRRAKTPWHLAFGTEKLSTGIPGSIPAHECHTDGLCLGTGLSSPAYTEASIAKAFWRT